MYRHYKKPSSANVGDQKPEVPPKPPTRQQNRQRPIKQSKDEVKAKSESLLSDCWEEVDRQCSNYNAASTWTNPDTGLGWKTVRLFVSSTFTDFFNERDILVKKVFPELREWCEERKITLIECDLRWGVPKDSTTRDTICTCLEELDRCYEENEGEPFFLNMLGERYGWIPSDAEVSADLKEKYNWVSNTSITFMEILCGAYRIKNANAAFLLRNADFVTDIPDEYRRMFVDDEIIKKEHLKELKKRIRERFPQQTFDYICKLGEIDRAAEKGKPKVPLTGLDEFAQRVLDFFKEAIERKYPDQQNVKTLDEWQQERQLQLAFLKQKAESMIGREREISLLLSFAQGEKVSDLELSDGDQEGKGSRKAWEVIPEHNVHLTVISPPGFGKTSLMAKVTMEAMKKGLNVFYHFVGSTSQSVTAEKLLARLLRTVMEDPSEEKIKEVLGEEKEDDKVAKKLISLLEQTDKQLLILLDGVNQLLSRNSASHLSWLPPGFPEKVRCIVSAATEHEPTVSSLLEFPIYKVTLGEVVPKVRREIVIHNFGRFNKRLDEEQLKLVVSHTCANQPLWLTIVCEELRVFGDFGTLTDKISQLPGSLDGLLEDIIERMLLEDGTDLMRKGLCLISCARRGLPVADVLGLLGNIESKEAVPLAYWAQVRRCLKPFLRTVTTRDGERVFYFHQAMELAVRAKLLPEKKEELVWYEHVANYLEHWCENKQLRRTELPDYLSAAGLNHRLVKFLRTSPESREMNDHERRQYMQSCRCRNFADPHMAMVTPMMLCMMCGMKKGHFLVNSMGKNTDTCVVCGAWVFPGAPSGSANICTRHSMEIHSTQAMKKCFICKIPTMHNFNVAQGKLCQMCRMSMGGKQCAIVPDK